MPTSLPERLEKENVHGKVENEDEQSRIIESFG